MMSFFHLFISKETALQNQDMALFIRALTVYKILWKDYIESSSVKNETVPTDDAHGNIFLNQVSFGKRYVYNPHYRLCLSFQISSKAPKKKLNL